MTLINLIVEGVIWAIIAIKRLDGFVVYGSDICAAGKRITADGGQSFGESNAGEHGEVTESVFRDSHYRH